MTKGLCLEYKGPRFLACAKTSTVHPTALQWDLHGRHPLFLKGWEPQGE